MVHKTTPKKTDRGGGVTTTKTTLYFDNKSSASKFIEKRFDGEDYGPLVNYVVDTTMGLTLGMAGPLGVGLTILIGGCNALSNTANNNYKTSLGKQIDGINSETICVDVVIWDNPRGVSGVTYSVREWQ